MALCKKMLWAKSCIINQHLHICALFDLFTLWSLLVTTPTLHHVADSCAKIKHQVWVTSCPGNFKCPDMRTCPNLNWTTRPVLQSSACTNHSISVSPLKWKYILCTRHIMWVIFMLICLWLCKIQFFSLWASLLTWRNCFIELTHSCRWQKLAPETDKRSSKK